MRRRISVLVGCGAVIALVVACSQDQKGAPAVAASDAGPPPQTDTITIASRTTRFVVEDHMRAAFEMQLSGEPFATSMGRDLSAYSRDWTPPNIYFDPSPTSFGPWIDLPGFSSGIESYEYSKQPMNNLAFESGAGVSLAYGSLINPGQLSGSIACGTLRQRVQHLGAASNGTSRFIHAEQTATNPLGWPGIWPTLAPFISFDPTIAATSSVSEACSITSDDDPGASGAMMSDDYECDATSLHLPNRAAQVDSAISPGSSGWAGWKSALWILNYLQVMHDLNETGITSVADSDLPNVGTPGNQILSTDVGDSPDPVAGTYLGSSDIEGFQAGMMLTALDNEASDWLTAHTTTDGATLSGFPDTTTALAYDTTAPLRWFPAEISVTESADAECAFPRPTGYAIRSGGSRLIDLAGILGTYSSLYALTDQANVNTGGAQAAEAYFDGDPFPADDQIADGEDTLHDRALGMMRVTLVNVLRMHVDPASGIPVDDVTVANGAPVRGTTLDAGNGAYMLLALRTARRSLSDLLTLYSNTKPDEATASTPIDAPPIAASVTVTSELNTLVGTLSDLFYDHLTDANGRAWAGWDVSKSAPTSSADLLDSHTAAVRALFTAYLASGNVKYRDRALAVFQRADAVFWDTSARIYRTVAGDTSSTVTYAPVRFGLLQAMLRDTYELVGANAGDGPLAALLLDRVGRMNKVVLNGWDDRNGDQKVDYPGECMLSAGGIPRGGLQMGERTLTGESGSNIDTFDSGTARTPMVDRDSDCVPEISAAQLPAALADSVTFQITKGGAK
jgi:hypothetical protein